MIKNKKAFTLIELIVTITIVSILATIAFVSFQGYRVSARDSVRLSDM
jgi:prepilin-type N-terminal cleavage/methylation domain-containing protein